MVVSCRACGKSVPPEIVAAAAMYPERTYDIHVACKAPALAPIV